MCFATKSQERKEEIMKNVKPVFRSDSLFNVLTFYKQCHNAKKKKLEAGFAFSILGRNELKMQDLYLDTNM